MTMRRLRRDIALLLLAATCSSCVPKTRISFDDFLDYYFTKWVADNGLFTFYVEGKGKPSYGYLYYPGNEFRRRAGVKYYYSVMRLDISGEGEYRSYDIEKHLENGVWNGKMHVYRSKPEESFLLTPVPVLEDEIDPNHFRTTNLIGERGHLAFIYSEDDMYSRKNSWVYASGGNEFALSFGEGKTFKIDGGEETWEGAYEAGYDSMELRFSKGQLFEGKESLTLKYYFGSSAFKYDPAAYGDS